MTSNPMCYPDSTNWRGFELPTDPTDLETEDIALAESLAWTTLQSLTGYQVAACPITVRPSNRRHRQGIFCWPGDSGYGGRWLTDLAFDGQWVECRDEYTITLPGPVGGIMAVTIDGTVLSSSAYRVDNGNRLVRQDGDIWPQFQDFDLPDGEVGTFSITYLQGAPSDAQLDYAAGVLAIEYWLSLGHTGPGKQKCRLPDNVTGVTRQGVTFSMATSLFDSGVTGIREVDAVIRRFNPFLLKSPSTVSSIDTILGRPRARRY